MHQQPKDQQRKPGHSHRSPLEEVIRQLQKAEENEFAGRNKNTGQKDHPGERKQGLWSHGQQKHQRPMRELE